MCVCVCVCVCVCACYGYNRTMTEVFLKAFYQVLTTELADGPLCCLCSNDHGVDLMLLKVLKLMTD